MAGFEQYYNGGVLTDDTILRPVVRGVHIECIQGHNIYHTIPRTAFCIFNAEGGKGGDRKVFSGYHRFGNLHLQLHPSIGVDLL